VPSCFLVIVSQRTSVKVYDPDIFNCFGHGRLQKSGTYWFKFLFQGQIIRESAKTDSQRVAREAERARRRDLELGDNRIAKRERVALFAVAAKEWLLSKSALTPLGRVYYQQYSRKLVGEFGTRLVSDIGIPRSRSFKRSAWTRVSLPELSTARS
jgi:hypothetical protein